MQWNPSALQGNVDKCTKQMGSASIKVLAHINKSALNGGAWGTAQRYRATALQAGARKFSPQYEFPHTDLRNSLPAKGFSTPV